MSAVNQLHTRRFHQASRGPATTAVSRLKSSRLAIGRTHPANIASAQCATASGNGEKATLLDFGAGEEGHLYGAIQAWRAATNFQIQEILLHVNKWIAALFSGDVFNI